ncbi:Uncharacterised protein [Salmonella enterica]|nr:Uncharacterised protein [Salmonella enterica]
MKVAGFLVRGNEWVIGYAIQRGTLPGYPQDCALISLCLDL